MEDDCRDGPSGCQKAARWRLRCSTLANASLRSPLRCVQGSGIGEGPCARSTRHDEPRVARSPSPRPLPVYRGGGAPIARQELHVLIRGPILRRTMPFEITTTRTFSAAHQLRLYDGSLEPLHGHNWRVRVTVGGGAARPDRRGDGLPRAGAAASTRSSAPLHNRHLNETPAFASLNPSAENVALHIGRSLRLPDGVTPARRRGLGDGREFGGVPAVTRTSPVGVFAATHNGLSAGCGGARAGGLRLTLPRARNTIERPPETLSKAPGAVRRGQPVRSGRTIGRRRL